MPAKKAKKTAGKAIKAAKIKKPAAKKTVAKKPIAKKTSAKKIAKKQPNKKPSLKAKNPAKTKKAVAKKPAKKLPAKLVKTAPLKSAKKPVKSKAERKKPAAQKKPTTKTAVVKNKKESTSLAKKIMSAYQKNNAAVAESKPVEKKSEVPQKAIIAKKPDSNFRPAFKIGDYAIYPSHGIGKIVDIEKTSILGKDFSCYLMYFEKEKLTIKIPMESAEKIGLRHLISKAQMDEVFVILRSGIKKLKGMWSRRAQEYETKINSGDIMLLAEVLRDLTRDIEDGERSYSERIIYETAINRLAGEYAAIYDISFEEAKEKIILTAKDKLNAEGKITQKDEFDDFDAEIEDSELDEDEDSEDDEEGDEDDEDDDYDDDDDEDDDAPRKRKRKK